MKIGIMGLPYSGKTTLFTTLLAHKIHDDNNKYKTYVEKGIVQIPDQRLDKLTSIFNPKKQVNATIEYVKVPGIIVEGDIVDLRVFNEAEALSKVEAFVETMDHYRELRRQEGLSW